MRVEPLTWEAAFVFAHEESMRAFEALAHGDTEAARSLFDSAKVANGLARDINAQEHD